MSTRYPHLPTAASPEGTAISMTIVVDGAPRILTLTPHEAARLANRLIEAAHAADRRARQELVLDLLRAERDMGRGSLS